MFISIKPIPPIDFRKATEGDFDFLYAMHIATMKDYVDQIWGWDDAFQESLFRERYIPSQIQVITFEGKDIGMISLEERTDDVFLVRLKFSRLIKVKALEPESFRQLLMMLHQNRNPLSYLCSKVIQQRAFMNDRDFQSLKKQISVSL